MNSVASANYSPLDTPRLLSDLNVKLGELDLDQLVV